VGFGGGLQDMITQTDRRRRVICRPDYSRRDFLGEILDRNRDMILTLEKLGVKVPPLSTKMDMDLAAIGNRWVSGGCVCRHPNEEFLVDKFFERALKKIAAPEEAQYVGTFRIS
jgi:hypothetical protein